MSFGNELRAFAEKTGDKLEDVAREVMINIGRSVVEKSPVGDPSKWNKEFHAVMHGLGWTHEGYVGGRFRANWQHGFGTPANGALDDIDASGGVSIAHIQSGTEGSPAAGIHFISNNLPYAQRLEDGYSSQAPSGMVSLTAIEFKDIVNISVQKAKQ